MLRIEYVLLLRLKLDTTYITLLNIFLFFSKHDFDLLIGAYSLTQLLLIRFKRDFLCEHTKPTEKNILVIYDLHDSDSLCPQSVQNFYLLQLEGIQKVAESVEPSQYHYFLCK